MATKDELKAEIAQVLEAKGETLPQEVIDDANHAALTKILKDLLDATPEKIDGEYVVVKGVTLTSRRGIEKEGATVKANCFAGGQESIDALLKKGFIE